ANQLPGPPQHPDPVEKPGYPLPRLFLLEPVQTGLKTQVLGTRQVAVAKRLVAQVADPAPGLPGLTRQGATEHRDLPGGGAEQGRQNPQQGGFAGAVGAQHGQRLAHAELETMVSSFRLMAPSPFPE